MNTMNNYASKPKFWHEAKQINTIAEYLSDNEWNLPTTKQEILNVAKARMFEIEEMTIEDLIRNKEGEDAALLRREYDILEAFLNKWKSK